MILASELEKQEEMEISVNCKTHNRSRTGSGNATEEEGTLRSTEHLKCVTQRALQ